MFWCNSVSKLSSRLWLPNSRLRFRKDMRGLLQSDNPHINFSYFDCKHARISRSFVNSMTDIPVVDNTVAKNTRYTKLYKAEVNRFIKEMDKHEGDSYDIFYKLVDNHYLMESKIVDKVNKMDAFDRSHRIQILPNPKQKQILTRWFDSSIYVYNMVVKDFNVHYNNYKKQYTDTKIRISKIKSNTDFPLNFYKLRDKYMNILRNDPRCVLPYCVAADVIKEFISNVRGNLTKISKYNIQDFAMTERNNSTNMLVLPIEKHYTYSTGFYTSILKSMKIRDKNFDWKDIERDYKLIYVSRTKKYYIQVPVHVFPKVVKQPNEICVFDPGERTFQTGYCLDHILDIGTGLSKVIRKRLVKIDKINSKIDNCANNKRKKRLRNAISKHHHKIDTLVKELHVKTCLMLCRNYKRIMVTNFSSKKVGTKKGNLNKMSKRVLGKMSHYKFRQTLKEKCEEYGSQYIEVTEEYTSKTCGRCGNIKKDLGSSKEYKCNKCKLVIDRDINGARNILLKNKDLILQ